MNAERPKVIVCGTKFGQVYLEAFRRPGCTFELAGVLGQGSERSQSVAEHYRVPLYTSPDQLPDDIAMACVIVRGGLLGGPGVEIAKALLERRISVVQEHPLHHDELAECMRTARRHGAAYTMSTFYPYLDPVRRFLGSAQELLREQNALYLDAATGFQVAFALFDILGRAVGATRPWRFPEVVAVDSGASAALRPGLDVPFRSIDAVFGGVPLSLRVHNQMDPADPDNYAHLMHRVLLGTESGALHLTGTHGPTLWQARPDFPKEVRERQADPHFSGDGDDDEPGSSVVLGPASAPSFGRAFSTVWPDGVLRVLGQTWAAAQAGKPRTKHDQYYLTLCQIWQELTKVIGAPELVTSGEIPALTTERLRAIERAGDDEARS